jgi:hypothetical protein
MSKKKSQTRTQLRAMQRERAAANEKRIAKEMGMPKGLRQYFTRLGQVPSMIRAEYRKWAYQ